jgi:hypothetical protein
MNEQHPEWSKDGTKIVFDEHAEKDKGFIQYCFVSARFGPLMISSKRWFAHSTKSEKSVTSSKLAD